MEDMASNIDLDKLTAEERLALLEKIWDSLTPDDVPLTSDQRLELDRRLDDLDRDGPIGIPWEDVLSRIRDARR